MSTGNKQKIQVAVIGHTPVGGTSITALAEKTTIRVLIVDDPYDTFFTKDMGINLIEELENKKVSKLIKEEIHRPWKPIKYRKKLK